MKVDLIKSFKNLNALVRNSIKKAKKKISKLF